jgi:hypothetical protein
VAGQIHEARMEVDRAATRMGEHRTLLVVDQDLAGRAAEPLEGADQPFIGVLGVLGLRAPEVEAAGEAQRVYDDVDRRRLAGDHRPLSRPIALELPPGLRLEADRRPTGPQRALGMEVVAQDGDPPGVPLRLELPPDHHGVPDALGQQLIDDRSVGSQHTPPPAAPAGRRSSAFEGTPHRPGMDPQLPGDVTEIDAALDQCLNHHEVLRRQHVPLLPDDPIGRGTFSLVVGGLPISVFSGLLSQALTVVRHPGRDPKNNPRFVVTNLADAPEAVYQIYCGRGDMENRLKELHHGLAMDRTSCHRFLANQFRVLLTIAAYILFQSLQAHAQGTACADAQVSTLRERLIKLAAWVERSVRRIVLHLPTTYPWRATWRQLARRVGAAPA